MNVKAWLLLWQEGRCTVEHMKLPRSALSTQTGKKFSKVSSIPFQHLPVCFLFFLFFKERERGRIQGWNLGRPWWDLMRQRPPSKQSYSPGELISRSLGISCNLWRTPDTSCRLATQSQSLPLLLKEGECLTLTPLSCPLHVAFCFYFSNISANQDDKKLPCSNLSLVSQKVILLLIVIFFGLAVSILCFLGLLSNCMLALASEMAWH